MKRPLLALSYGMVTTMADIHDVADAVASALTEVGLHGYVDVEMDGTKLARSVGELGDDVEVTVTVRPLSAAS